MRKRLSSKVLAVILTLAICATTVFGCLMSVTAATSCYSFGVAKFPSATDLSQATVDVTFQHAALPDGIVAGMFEWTELGKDNADYLSLREVTAKTAGVEVEFDEEENLILFNANDAKTAVVLTFVFDFSKGSASKSKTYYIQLNEIELAFNDNVYYEKQGLATGEISAECEHVVSVVGAPVAIDRANGYSVYENSICTICGETFGKQLVPTADALGGETASNVNPTIQWDGTSKTAPTEGSGTEADPYIISEVSHLAYITEAGPDYTHGKFFKVKDGIKNIVLQKAADANTLINIKSAEEAKTYLSSLSGRSRWNTGKYDAASAFCGTFDGNGATIYGLSAETSINISLFGSIGPKAEFKNLSIKNSFIQTGWYAATLAHTVLGYTLTDGTAVAKGTVKIDNCTFANNYINPQSGVNGGTTGNQCIGVILGNYNASASGSGLAINNILVYDNITFYEKQQQNISPLIGAFNNTPAPTAETATEYCELMDSILLDCTGDILANNNSNFKGYQNIQNVYTDSTWVSEYLGKAWYNTNDANVVTKAQMLGNGALTAAPNLAWGTEWLLGDAGELPSLVEPGFVSDTIYWDGSNTKTAPTKGSGTKADPYIINTVAELAYVSGQAKGDYTVTDGKFYKVADHIKNIVMQPYAYANDIMALNSSAEVKAYFEANSAKLKQWLYYGWEGSTFCGDIDFNGATVYGIYQVSSSNAGLFSNADAGAVFRNLAIKNSYMKSESANKNYQIGAIAAVTNGTGHGKDTSGIIWALNCTVANNYMYDNVVSTGNQERAGVLFGAATDAIYIDNALVYGNDATYGDGVTMPLYAAAANAIPATAPAPEDLVTVCVDKHQDGYLIHHNMVRNSILIGVNPVDYSQAKGSRFNDPTCFVNVYTDIDVATKTFSDGKTVLGASDEQIKTINVADITGTAAKVAMPNLTWGTDWYLGATGEYPVLSAFVSKVGTSSVSTGTFKLYGANTVYNDDGTFDFNLHYIPPYAGFTPTLYVGTLDGSKFMKLTATASSLRGDLGANALMFTIPNISAKDINKVWLPTIVTDGAAMVEWGLSKQIALGDYSRAILEGNYSAADKAVAAATLNYSTASEAALSVAAPDYNAGTIDLLEFGDYLTKPVEEGGCGSSNKYYDTNVADNGETGTANDPIIIDSAEEFVYLAKGSGNETAGKYYKVADGIAGFNLSTNKLDITKGYDANKAVITGSGKNHSGNTPGFQGHFDGNGATVYGAWTSDTSGYAGLFGCTKGDVSIKNINVRLSHFYGKYSVGGIVGYHEATLTAAQAKTATQNSGALVLPQNGTLLIENCSVAECYLESTGTGYGTGAVAAILGYENNSWSDSNITYAKGLVDDSALTLGYYDVDGNGKNTYYNGEFTINNCYVNLDNDKLVSAYAADNQAVRGGLAAYAGTNAGVFKNCIVIGITPYSTYKNTANNNHQHTALASHFSNIYTTAATGKVTIGGSVGTNDFTGKVFQLTEAQLTGLTANANMPALDWNNVWTTTSGYPTFISKNYVAPASGRVISWDGSVATGISTGSGTKADPFIINTAAELAWLVQQKANVTLDKHYKIADGITAIVLQSANKASDIIALNSAAETKAYFESGSHTQWKVMGWEQSSFCGTFDGNGATIYGMYATSTSNAALFCTVDAGATIKNIGVKNSYLTSSANNYQVAAIAAVTSNGTNGANNRGMVWFNSCTVANCYMRSGATTVERTGVIFGAASEDTICIDNALVYGNDAYYGANYENKTPLYATVNNATPIEGARSPEGLTVKTSTATVNKVPDVPVFYNMVRNSVILDCDVMNVLTARSYRKSDKDCYVNVYTNGASGTVNFTDGSWTYPDANIKAISKEDAFGAGAKDAMPNLAWDDVWFAGATGDAPGFKPAGEMPSSIQTKYDSVILDTYDDYGDSVTSFGVYSTGLNLKANPYMTFTFEFGGEYTRSENVVVTFKSGDKVIETVTAAQMTNNDGAGRFHLYRLKSAPVTALATGISVSVSYNGGAAVDFGTYSAEGFALMADNANKQQPCEYYATRLEAAKALLFYAQTLAARYGA